MSAVDQARQAQIAAIRASIAHKHPNMSPRNRDRLVAMYVAGFEDGAKAMMRIAKKDPRVRA